MRDRPRPLVRPLVGPLVGAVVVAAPFVVGACVGAAADEGGRGERVVRLADPEIVESSGLVVSTGRVVTTNDSGDAGRVFVVDPGTGRTVGVTRWAEEPEDVEALAPAGPGHVWVGDIGDNAGRRDSVEVARVPVAARDQEVEVATTALVYPGGGRDAEALLAHPRTGRLLVVTKGALAGEVFAVPATPVAGTSQRLRSLGPAPGLVTDGAFFPDGRHLVLRTYTRAVVLAHPSLEVVGSWRLPVQPQGEGVAVGPDGGIYLSSEGIGQPLLRVEVPRGVARRMVSGAGGSRRTPGAEADAGAVSEPAPAARDRDPWSWALGGGVLLLVLVVLVRSLRPPR